MLEFLLRIMSVYAYLEIINEDISDLTRKHPSGANQLLAMAKP